MFNWQTTVYSVKLLLLRGSRTDGLPDQPAGRQADKDSYVSNDKRQ